MSRIRTRAILRQVLLVVLGASSLAAQDAGNSAVLLDKRDLALILGATAGSAIISRWDVPIARAFADSGIHSHHRYAIGANRASMVTETMLMLTGGVVYGVARWRRNDDVADVAFHTTEGVASAAMFIQVVRGALGRGRPYVVDDSGDVRDTDPYEFSFMRGFTSFNYRSWPSMHAMASFAAASALSTEMRWRNTPGRHAATAALFGAATIPSIARMYLDEHWASDIAMGMFLGVFAGQKAVNYSHAHPDNRPDHFFLSPRVRATITLDGQSTRFSLTPE